MYTQLAERLFITAQTYQVSQAVSTEGGNTVRADFTVFAGSLDEVTVQESNDLENWVDTATLSGGSSWAAPTYAMPAAVTVSAAFVRLKWESQSVDNDIIVAGGINLSSQ